MQKTWNQARRGKAKPLKKYKLKKTCIVIAGPTAVGKTAAAIAIAKTFRTSIISADSRQCYREMNIGVAKPSAEQLHEVPHYFINSHSVTDVVNASVFEEYALDSVQEIFRQNDVAVVTGGTGLYLKAFCEGLDDIPAISDAVKSKVKEGYAAGGLEWLKNEIRDADSDFFAHGEIGNPHRVMRALEVKLSTGNTLQSYQHQQPKQRPFQIIKIGLTLPKEELNHRIEIRTDAMMEAGLADEVKSLVHYRYLTALQTVGYSELFEWLDGSLDFNTAVARIRTNTKQYAKRQLTWFRKDKGYQWFSPFDQDQLSGYLLTTLAK
ncbi:MAG: tRNA (adenosine(37)-N6)-dimethylallyltransferase MiaA [Gemmatimonadaceae bacterium]|nr:tRNA (adenosine(37)-N6)-dimethylallyltransferase MiaA [Chitinophagaceae bacterium]